MKKSFIYMAFIAIFGVAVHDLHAGIINRVAIVCIPTSLSLSGADQDMASVGAKFAFNSATNRCYGYYDNKANGTIAASDQKISGRSKPTGYHAAFASLSTGSSGAVNTTYVTFVDEDSDAVKLLRALQPSIINVPGAIGTIKPIENPTQINNLPLSNITAKDADGNFSRVSTVEVFTSVQAAKDRLQNIAR